MSASTVRFILNGEVIETEVVDPTRTVLPSFAAIEKKEFYFLYSMYNVFMFKKGFIAKCDQLKTHALAFYHLKIGFSTIQVCPPNKGNNFIYEPSV